MRTYRVSFLVEEGSLPTIIASIGACATSGLAIAEHVPAPNAPPPPTTGAKQLELDVKKPPRPLNEARSKCFKAAKEVLDDTAPGGIITKEQLKVSFAAWKMEETSIGPITSYMVAKGYIARLHSGTFLKL